MKYGYLILLLISMGLHGQSYRWDSSMAYQDTFARYTRVNLDPFVLVEKQRYHSREDYVSFWRTRYYVTRVLPYAREALMLLRATEDTLATLDRKRHQKRYLRHTYDELKDLYKGEMKQMYVEEGRILIKIIERETGRPFFDLVKAYRGLDDALFWQGVAKLHGYSLREGYDPKKEPELEEILSAMESSAIE